MTTKNVDLQGTPLRPTEETGSQGGHQPTEFNVAAEIAALEDLADWLDSKFEIPGTGVRFGIDPILGLIPGIGDTLSAIPAGHIILTARRLGAPGHLIARMIANIGIDAITGFIPMLGDLLDVGFKANRRNVELLRQHFGVETTLKHNRFQ